MPETEFILGKTTCENCKSRVASYCLRFPPNRWEEHYYMSGYPKVCKAQHFSNACEEWELKPKETENEL